MLNRSRLLACALALLLGLLLPLAAAASPPRANGEELLSFAALGAGELSLRGPADGRTVEFSLPATWAIRADGTLSLSFVTFFAGGTEAAQPAEGTSIEEAQATGRSFGGILQIQLNGETIGSILLDAPGEQTVTLTLPRAALEVPDHSERHQLAIRLETNERCMSDDFTSVIIRPSSSLTLPYSETQPPTDLTDLPWPIVQRSFAPDTALLVVPDQPSAAEIQGALAVMAGFGRLAGADLDLRLIPLAQLTPELRREQHLIFIGKEGALPILRSVPLPEVRGASPAADDGLVRMAVSPWNEAKVVLAAGGDSDAAVLKAAQAISGGALRPTGRTSLAIVTQARDIDDSRSYAVSSTFAELGYGVQQMFGVGEQYARYQFEVPPGMGVSGEAYLDLAFLHTGLLDYDQSGLMISLNGEPVASVRLDDTSTRLAVTRVALPATALRPGINQLTIRGDLLPRAICTDPRGSGLWMTVRPESLLHLPLAPLPEGESDRELALKGYPALITVDPSLGSLAIVVPPDDPASWAAAAAIAYDLGRQSQDGVVQLRVAFADAIPEGLRDEYDLLLVGRPSDLPLLIQLGDALPAPFAPDSDFATDEGSDVVYRMEEGANISYLELLPAPWNSQRAILAVLGSSDVALDTAAQALIDPTIRSQLAGNLAVITGEQVESFTIAPPPPPEPTPQPEEPVPAEEDSSLLLLLGAGTGALMLLLAGAFLGVWWRGRRRLQRLQSQPAPEANGAQEEEIHAQAP